MDLRYTPGDVVSWFFLSEGRGNSSDFPVMATYFETFPTVPGDPTEEQLINAIQHGTPDTNKLIEKSKKNDSVIEAGPMPLMPYWWPKEKEGIEVPDSFPHTPANKPVTKELLKSLPHTFIRRTSFIEQYNTSCHLGSAYPVNNIKDAQEASGHDKPEINQSSFAWWQVSYQGYPEGFTHSSWIIWIDGQPESITIEHRKLLSNGLESDSLTRYWKPKDIWKNIFIPRIKLNKPIKNMAPIAATGGVPIEIIYSNLGNILNTRYIQAASMIYFPEAINQNQIMDSWTITHDIEECPDDNEGIYFEVWPGFYLPNLAWFIKYVKNTTQTILNLAQKKAFINTAISRPLYLITALKDAIQYIESSAQVRTSDDVDTTPSSTTNAAFEDVPGMQMGIPVPGNNKKIHIIAAFESTGDGANPSHGEFCLNIDGMDYPESEQEIYYGSTGAIQQSSCIMDKEIVSAGNRLIKLRYRRSQGTGNVTFNRGQLFCMVL